MGDGVCPFSLHQSHIWSREELLDNLSSVIKLIILDEDFQAARDGIGPHPADILILEHALDAATFQDGFEQIHSLVTVMTMILNSFSHLTFHQQRKI